jgi:AraC-like DNA-binding protein
MYSNQTGRLNVRAERVMLKERFFSIPPEPTWWGILPVIMTQVGHARWPPGHFHGRTLYKDLGITLVTAGNAVFRQDSDEFLLEPGMIMIKLPGHSHYWATGPAGYLHTRFMHFVGPGIERMIQLFKLDKAYVATASRPSAFSEDFRIAQQLAIEQRPGFSLKLSALGYRMLAQIAHELTTAEYPPQMISLIEYLQRSIHQSLSVEDMARHLSISRAQLFRMFHRYLGQSPHTYFNGLRLEYARTMLSTGRHTVKQVALSLRYKDPFIFSKQFMKRYKYNPSKVRLEAIRGEHAAPGLE